MRNFAVLFTLILFSLTAFGQKPKPGKKSVASAKTNLVKTTESPVSEREEFDKAVATENALKRIGALQKFINAFPQSAEKTKAQELIVSARAAVGDEKLRLSETESGKEFFMLAVKDAPKPVSDKFFGEVLLQFPTNLFWRGERAAALEIARMIEEKADGNGQQLLGLASFYIGIENAAEAERLANKVIALNTHLPAAYQTLGLAYRVNFQLEESANAYAKALEFDAESIVSKRSLAEMKRAVGKPDEAVALYREILSKDDTDAPSRTGLVLALFDAGKRSEAETEMTKSLAANPNNLLLLVGAAYWFAANNDGAKAVELAGKAVEIEPRYTWAHIALARGFLQQKRPLEAERTLLAARQYGNFPTLDYELAAARLASGFYREAADVLRKNFSVKGETVQTKLGGRLLKESKNFIELLELERRASIFQPLSADNSETAEKLKSLLDFSQKLEAAQPDETEISVAADEFVKGDDKMKLHRQLFVANRLLQSNKSLPKALELAQAAVGKTDAALDVPNASAAVLADELYESRTLANTKNQLILVPEIPRQTLSAVLRGRIEEISGWTLYHQNKLAEAAVHLKRAVSVLPEKSAWWNSSMWRLGAALQADGKEKEALDAYIASYPKDSYDGVKYSVIEALYQKINGGTEGLGDRLVAKAESAATAQRQIKSGEQTAQNAETANPKADVPAAPANDSKIVSESISASKIAPQRATRFPKEVPVKVETAKSSEVNTAAPLPVNTEEKQNPPTEVIAEAKPSPIAEVPAEVKPTPNQITEKPIAVEENPSIVEEKPVTVEKKPTVIEEKPIVVEEKPVEIEENPTSSEEKLTVSEEKPTLVEEKPILPVTSPPEEKNQPTTENPVKTETIVTPEVKPVPEETASAKMELPSKPETNTEQKNWVVKIEEMKKAEVQTNTPKPLFDPIVITVPKSESEKTTAPEKKPNVEQPVQQDSKQNEIPKPLSTEKPKTQEISPEDTTLIEKPVDKNTGISASRSRVVVTENLPAAMPEIQPCSIVVGQENISLLGGGGGIGILVGFKDKGDLKQLVAKSESPDDIEIVFDPEIGEIAGRAFFIVKSINTVKGSYKITFEAPCGKKEITIKVR